MASESDVPAAVAGKSPGPELRLLDRRAFVGFPPLPLGPGVSITDFALQIPDVTFPFDVSAGPGRYQRRRLAFGYLELSVETEAVTRALAAVSGRLGELEQVKLHFRAGVLEAQAQLANTERAPLTFKVAFDGDGERLAVYVYDVRLYSFSPTPAPLLPLLLTRALTETGLLPEVEVRGGTGFTTRLLGALCQRAAVSRGYKLPHLDEARLAAAEISPRGLKLRFASGGLPPPNAPDEELLLTLEGARAFAEAEELLALGRLEEAREAYLKAGDASEAHPFAAERLLQLLVADPTAHELAIDVAGSLARRRERSPAAMWAEAVVRERRGESARAAERFLALCAHARRHGEDASAFFAAEAAARASRDSAPQVAVRALHEVLGLRPDHLPSLQALARAADQAGDRVGAVRAWRRIAALARDTNESASAHVHLARLSSEAEDDVAGARLHCEAALRLTPDHPEALLLLGELCHRSGEHLRGLKALDRLRDVALARHELDRVARAALLAGRIWEEGLQQPENALLRYREAVGLLPQEAEPHALAGRVAESLGRTQEALADYTQAVELAGPAPATKSARQAAHRSHHALARLSRTRLGDPSRARTHLEAALALEPDDVLALEELIPFFRATGRIAELAESCERAGRLAEEPARRAALWAEAGELHRTRLSQPDRAEQLLSSALEAEPRHRAALEGLLALAESRRDGATLCRCLKTLAELAVDAPERLRTLRRLAVAARDLAFDLELAVEALQGVLAIEPADLGALGELCALQRKRGDMAGLAEALEWRARASEAGGDKRVATAALRELAQVYETRLGRTGEALVALEKAARLSPDAGVLLELADLSLRTDRPEHARQALEDVLGSLPRTTAPERLADIRARLGQACEQLGDLDAAREHYARAFPLRRLDDGLAERLEGLYAQAGEERALAELRATRAQALLGAGRPAEAAPLFLRSAEGLLALGDLAPALMRLHAALEAVPEGEQAAKTLETLAALELQRGEKPEAARLLARKATLLEDDAEAAALLVRAAGLAEGTPREEGLLEDALARDGSCVPARLRRAQLRATADPLGALEDVEAVLARRPHEPGAIPESERLELLRRAADLAVGAGQWDTARRHLVAYAARRPQDTEALVELAALHRRAGAREALCDLLGELWPRLTEDAQRSARRELVELALALDRTSEAIETLRAIRVDAPQDAWAASTLLETLGGETATSAALDERRELLSVLIAVESSAPARATLHVRRARLHREVAEVDAARRDLEEAARLSTDPAPLQRELAELYRLLGDAAAELSAWRFLLTHVPELRAEGVARLSTLAQALLEQGRTQEAREGFEALGAQPLEADARCEVFLGLARACADAPLEAAAALLEASRQGPVVLRVGALLERARLLDEAGDRAASVESLRALLALSPGHVEAGARLKEALRGLGDHAALAELLHAEAEASHGSEAAGLFRELGALWAGPLDDAGRAEAMWRRVAALEPHDAAVRLQLVELLLARGARAEAVPLLEEAANSLEERAAAAVLRRAAAFAQEGADAETALRLARRAHALIPAEGADLALLAELLYLRGAVAEALPLQQQLAAGTDFDTDAEAAIAAHLRLAELCEQQEDVAGAEVALRRVWQAHPEVASAAERLAGLLLQRDPRASLEVLWAHARALPVSEGTVSLRVHLAERARNELGDVELAVRLLGEAAQLTSAPLEILAQRAGLFRETGRSSDLLAELQQLARVAGEHGETERQLEALSEAADLAEQLGQVEEALRTLEAVREGHEAADAKGPAAAAELRRARLLRDVRLDLEAAAASLSRAFAFAPSLQVAQESTALAERRGDAEAQAHWLDAALPLLEAGAARAQAHLTRAELFESVLSDPGRAEAALRAALVEVPRLPAAEEALEALLRRQGRLAELAAYWEEAADHPQAGAERAALLRRAAALYRGEVGQPASAAIALWAARAAAPDDLELTRELADLLHEVDRGDEASDFDALLLAADPFLPEVYERHRAWLEQVDEPHGLATLMLGRAQRQTGREAAENYLVAADALRRTGATEQALLCEDSAFEQAPQHPETLRRLRERPDLDVRRQAELLARAASALEGSEEAVPLWADRARSLLAAGESLLAAEAFDDWLRHAADDVEALETRAELAAEAGGPRAAQPYDRRLLAVGGDALPVPVRVRSGLRLGHAALAGGALEDAAGAFETVLELAPEGSAHQEALSLLSEVHTRRGDDRGVYRTTLLLAKAAQGEEAEALYRRAANVLGSAAESLEALLPLAHLRPTDVELVERAAEGLRALARPEDLVQLYARSAEASGGMQAARWLLSAATTAERSLEDAALALRLRERAAQAAPNDAETLRALYAERVRRGDREAQRELLPRLIPLEADPQASAELTLVLAELDAGAGHAQRAVEVLESLVSRGPSGAGHTESLVQLEALHRASGDAAGLARVLGLRAELSDGEARAQLLREASEAHVASGALAEAIAAARRAAEVRPDADGLQALAALHAQAGELADAARVRLQAARLLEGEERARLLLEAGDGFASVEQGDEAQEAWEQAHALAPGMLPPLELAGRLQRVGAPARALALAAGPLREQERFTELLELADAAEDQAAVRDALWALAERAPTSVHHVERLAALLRQEGDWSQLLRLAEAADAKAPTVAAPLLDEVLFQAPDVALRTRALTLHLAREQGEAFLLALLPRLGEPMLRELADIALDAVRARPPEQREPGLQAALESLPEQRPGLLRELFSLRREAGRTEDAERTLAKLLQCELPEAERATVWTERGQLWATELWDQVQARACFEQALAAVPGHLPALEALLPLLSVPADAARFVEVAQRLEEQGAVDVLAVHREALADAFEAEERWAEAAATLARLEETGERLARRATLAERQGLTGEALMLRERVATSPAEREAILNGYLDAQLLPFAVRLGVELLSAGVLGEDVQRRLAERLAPTVQGAELAAQLWPDLLSARPADADGWTLFAESLRLLGQDVRAERMDGMGAALTDSKAIVAVVKPSPMERPVLGPEEVLYAAPRTSVPLTAESMPRLYAVLAPALEDLGAPGVSLRMDLEGGVEAWLAQDEVVVIGAGALSVFGPGELVYLVALALALGASGEKLTAPGEVRALPAAARRALRAVPSSLCAARVLAQLDGKVRGGDPKSVQVSRVLRDSTLLEALALETLALG